jgi:hypothetical protein
MRIAYIAHPIGGDVDNNIQKVIKIIRHINLTENDVVPLAPYIESVYSLDDTRRKERAKGIANNVALFRRGAIDELRLYGDRISDGMWDEIKLANELGIKINCMNSLVSREYDNNIEAFVMSFTKHEVGLLLNSLRYVSGIKLDRVFKDKLMSESQRMDMTTKAMEYDTLADNIENYNGN